MMGLIEALLTIFILLVIGTTVGCLVYVAYLVYNIIRQEITTDLDEDDV